MFRVHRDFNGLLKAAQDEYDSLVELNESLRKKVAEWNKDEEIRKAVELAEYNRTHSLCQMSDNEKEAEKAFKDSHYESCKNGGKYLYELTGTGIGTAITIKCPVCGEEKNITDYDCWWGDGHDFSSNSVCVGNSGSHWRSCVLVEVSLSVRL